MKMNMDFKENKTSYRFGKNIDKEKEKSIFMENVILSLQGLPWDEI